MTLVPDKRKSKKYTKKLLPRDLEYNNSTTILIKTQANISKPSHIKAKEDPTKAFDINTLVSLNIKMTFQHTHKNQSKHKIQVCRNLRFIANFMKN